MIRLESLQGRFIEDEPHAVAPQIAPEPHATPRRADAPRR